MRHQVALLACALVSWSVSPAAAEAPASPEMTAAVHVAATPIGAAAAQTRVPSVTATPARDEAADGPTSRPWLLVLTGVVLAGMMASRRL
jgi:hypothetical protein